MKSLSHIFSRLCSWKRAPIVFSCQNILHLNGNYVVQNQESCLFHHHKINAAQQISWINWPATGFNYLLWLAHIHKDSTVRLNIWEKAFERWNSVCLWWFEGHGNRGASAVSCLMVKSFPLSVLTCTDRNVEWKFHCTNWLLPMDFFTAINESVIVSPSCCISLIMAEPFSLFM